MLTSDDGSQMTIAGEAVTIPKETIQQLFDVFLRSIKIVGA